MNADGTNTERFSEARWERQREHNRKFYREKGISEERVEAILRKQREGWERARQHWLERERIKATNPALFADVLEILARYDPVGIVFPENPDEYDLEVGTILPRLSEASNLQDMAHVIHEEFLRWFGSDYFRGDSLREIASEIWEALRRHPIS